MVPRPSAPFPNGGTAAREPDGEGLPVVATTPIFGDATSHRSDALAGVRTGAAASLSGAQAAELGLEGADRVRLTTPHGSCVVPLEVDDRLQDGAVFVTTGVPGSGIDRILPADRGPVRAEVGAA